MTIKTATLLCQIFTVTSKLVSCLTLVNSKDNINLQELKSLKGHDVDAFYFTDTGERVDVFGMLITVYNIVDIKEKKSKKV